MKTSVQIQSQIDDNKEVIKDLKDEINDLIKQVNDLERENDNLEDDLEEAESNDILIATAKEKYIQAEVEYFIALDFLTPEEAPEYAKKRDKDLDKNMEMLSALKSLFK